MSHERISLGKKGELLVAEYLAQQGFDPIIKNFTCRHGEIDLIAHDGNLIACVEVKVRNNPYCTIAETVPYSKQKKIIMTARSYALQYGYREDESIVRFDVAFLEPQDHDYSITYIPNAFTLL